MDSDSWELQTKNMFFLQLSLILQVEFKLGHNK